MAMQRISTEAVLRGNVRKDSAWEIISDFTGFPGLISSVDKVTILERNEDVGKSEWFITVDNAPLRWTQIDRFDRKIMKSGLNPLTVISKQSAVSGRSMISTTKASNCIIPLTTAWAFRSLKKWLATSLKRK